MVHALKEAHRVLKPNGILLDLRPAAQHRRVGLGEGKRWKQVGLTREKFDDDHAADRAMRQVIGAGLFERTAHYEFDLDRVMDTLQDCHTWLVDFSSATFPSHEWLYQRIERALAKEHKDIKIVVRGLLKLGVLKKIEQQ